MSTLRRAARTLGYGTAIAAAGLAGVLGAELLAARLRRYARPAIGPGIRATIGEPPAPTVRLVMLGDSLAAGVGVRSVDESVGGHLGALLAGDGHRIELSSVAVSGTRSAAATDRRLARQTDRHRPGARGGGGRRRRGRPGSAYQRGVPGRPGHHLYGRLPPVSGRLPDLVPRALPRRPRRGPRGALQLVPRYRGGMSEAVIVATARSPIGRAGKGSLKDVRPDDLTASVIRAALDKVPGLDPTHIDDLYLGCGLPGGEQGFNMARVVSILLGYDHLPGATLTRYCASSLQTTRMAMHAIRAGEGEVFISAGVECVSRYARGNSDGLPPEAQALVGGGWQNPVFDDARARTAKRAEAGAETWTDPREADAVPD